MAAYPPLVEQWRGLVAKYFPAELVDKALHVIQYESNGNAKAVGDGGVAHGLFQIQDSQAFSNRPDGAYLQDPENNIKYAAEQLGGASGNFGAWGEGTQYNNKAFGALGNHPYEGSVNGRADTTSGIQRTYTGAPPNTGTGVAPTTTPSATPPTTGFGDILSKVLGQAKGMINDARITQKNAITLKGIKLPTPLALSGDYAKDRAAYTARADGARNAYSEYEASITDPLIVDPANGISQRFMGYDEAGNPILELDPVATRLYKPIFDAEQGLTRLDASRKAGLDGSGRTAAEAYLASELTKVSLASQSHEAYVKQINDLVAMDNKPQERAATLASTLSVMNAVNKSKESAPGYNKTGVMGTEGMPRLMDTSPFADAMKKQIPSSSPAPYVQRAMPSEVSTPSAPMPDPASGVVVPTPSTGFRIGQEAAAGTLGAPGQFTITNNPPVATLPWQNAVPSAVNSSLGNFSKFGTGAEAAQRILAALGIGGGRSW